MHRTHTGSSRTPQLDEAMARLIGEVHEGLAHGFFDFTVSCELVRDGKRRFTLKAGKSHRFTIPEAEIAVVSE